MRESLRALVGSDVESRVDIGLAKDGSGVGGQLSVLTICERTFNIISVAALCALQAVKQEKTLERALQDTKLG